MTIREIKLNSIASNEPLVFKWSSNPQDKTYGIEIIEFITLICDEYPIIKDYFDVNQLRIEPLNKKNFDTIMSLSCKYNESIENLKKNTDYNTSNALSELLNKRASKKLIKYIMHSIYNRAVYDPDKLNQYEPFSPQVYGETSYDLINEMLKQVKLGENDIFIDLGSGVGNVVLQVAAMCNCKLSFGIEKADWPCKYAVDMEKEFKLLMNWFGKCYSNFVLYKGDFLDDKDSKYNLKEMINEAKLIFVNNYAFGAEVDHQLKLRFSNMTEGAIILSSKPFCPLNFRINSRNLNDIGAILNVNEHQPICGHVSWTDKPINYYFHKIDRTLLEKYFERMKNPKSKDDSNSNDKRTSSNSLKRNSSTTDDDETNYHNNHNNNDDYDDEVNDNVKNNVYDDDYYDDENSNDYNSNSNDIDYNGYDEQNRDTSPKNRNKRSKRLKKELSNGNSKGKRIENKTTVGVGVAKSTGVMMRGGAPPSTMMRQNKKSSPNGLNTAKSLDSNAMNTLDIMHSQAVKASLLVGSNCTLGDQEGIDSNYNVKSMTKLTNANIDCKLLKDCTLMDLDEVDIIEQLGPEISIALDEYLKTWKKKMLNYLLTMKLPQYKELIKSQIRNELKIQNEILKKTEQIENKISSLVDSSVTLLKVRVTELGLKNIQTPKELIEFATQILGNHQELLNRVNNLQQTVDNLQMQNENLLLLNKDNKTNNNNNNNKVEDVVVVVNRTTPTHDNQTVKTTANYTNLFEPITPLKNENNNDDNENNENEKKQVIKLADTKKKSNSQKQASLKATNQIIDYSTYFNTAKSAELLRNFKIPKSSPKLVDDAKTPSPLPPSQQQQQPLSSSDFNSPKQFLSNGDFNDRKSYSSPNSPQLTKDSVVNLQSNSSPPTPVTSPSLKSMNSLLSDKLKNIESQFNTDTSPLLANNDKTDAYFNNNNHGGSYYHYKKKKFEEYMMESTSFSTDNDNRNHYNGNKFHSYYRNKPRNVHK